MHRVFQSIIPVLFTLLVSAAQAEGRGEYQSPEAFLANSFPGGVPDAEVVWLRGEVSDGIEAILGHRYPSLRIRYWRRSERTAWILEEIGKEQPITTGILINDGEIEALRVLIFRESRGWEVKYDFFTDQFDSARLKHNNKLDRRIDNISGATLSVRAVTRLARMALFLDQQVRE